MGRYNQRNEPKPTQCVECHFLSRSLKANRLHALKEHGSLVLRGSHGRLRKLSKEDLQMKLTQLRGHQVSGGARKILAARKADGDRDMRRRVCDRLQQCDKDKRGTERCAREQMTVDERFSGRLGVKGRYTRRPESWLSGSARPSSTPPSSPPSVPPYHGNDATPVARVIRRKGWKARRESDDFEILPASEFSFIPPQKLKVTVSNSATSLEDQPDIEIDLPEISADLVADIDAHKQPSDTSLSSFGVDPGQIDGIIANLEKDIGLDYKAITRNLLMGTPGTAQSTVSSTSGQPTDKSDRASDPILDGSGNPISEAMPGSLIIVIPSKYQAKPKYDDISD